MVVEPNKTHSKMRSRNHKIVLRRGTNSIEGVEPAKTWRSNPSNHKAHKAKPKRGISLPNMQPRQQQTSETGAPLELRKVWKRVTRENSFGTHHLPQSALAPGRARS